MVNALTFTSEHSQRAARGNSAIWALWDVLRQHPDFDAECVLYANERTDALLMRPYLSKITSTESRYVPMRGALSAYYGKIALTGDEGLTLSDVHQASLEGCDLGSRNRVTGLINALQSVGIVKVETSPFDRRERILRLTEVGNQVLDRIRRSSTDRVTKLLGIELAPVGDDRYYRDLADYYARGFAVANSEYRLSSIFPEYASFFDRTFGLELLNLLFIAASKSGVPRAGNITFSYSKMSEKFDISRAQMRQLVVHCQDVGLIKVHGLGGRETEITEKFIELYRSIIATLLAITAFSMLSGEEVDAYIAGKKTSARQKA
jgi:hypothetical protein